MTSFTVEIPVTPKCPCCQMIMLKDDSGEFYLCVQQGCRHAIAGKKWAVPRVRLDEYQG